MDKKTCDNFYLFYNNVLYDTIISLCGERKIPISKMTLDCELDIGFITKLKNSNTPLDFSSIEAIAFYFNLSVEELLSKTTFIDHNKKIASLKDFPYFDNLDTLSLSTEIKEYLDKLNLYAKYKVLKQIKEYTTNPLYMTSNSSSNNDIGEIAAWGAEGTEGSYEPPEEETT